MTSDPRSRPGRIGGSVRRSVRRSEWLAGALLALAFAPAWAALARVWSSVDHYSHGFLVPIVALWCADRSGPIVREPRDGRGVAALLGALVVYAIGLGIGSATVQGVSLVGAICAAVLYLGSTPALRAQRFALLFLLFMVPLPAAWLTPVIVALQLLVSSLAVDLLAALGSDVARAGNVIVLPDGGRLFVAEACSGITSIVTLFPLGVLLAYFTERSTVRRLAIVGAVVPAAMAGNLLRVVLTVAAAERYGVERATGHVLHEWAGVLTFALATGALIALGALMRRASGVR